MAERHQGSGTWVTTPGGDLAKAGELASAGEHRLASLGLDEIDDATISLVAAAPPVPEGLAELAAHAAAGLTGLAHGGYLPLGYPPLREEIAKRLSARGLPTSSAQVLVTTGAQQAIAISGLAFVSPGEVVVIEDPTYPGAIDAYRHVGARLLPVSMGSGGFDLEWLAASLQETAVRLVHVTPSFQNPTGYLMPLVERVRLAQLTQRGGAILVEDETVAELALGEDAPPPIAANAVGASVLTIGSLSKLCWGGLRVGWVRAPHPLISRMARIKAVLDLGSSVPSQLLATTLLRQGSKLRKPRLAEIRSRYELLASLLERLLSDWRFDPPAGGLVVWAKLPYGSASDLAAVARQAGVAVLPGPMTSPSGRFDGRVRLPFVAEPALIEKGLRRLAGAWETYTGAGATERELRVVV